MTGHQAAQSLDIKSDNYCPLNIATWLERGSWLLALFVSENAEPSPPLGFLHGGWLAGVALAAVEPVVEGGGEVAVVVLEGWVVADAEEEDEEEAEQEVGEQQEAVAQQEHVEQILLDPDHGAVCRSEAAVTLTSQ